MKLRCGCCEGVEVLTPAKIWNRPGLSAIHYRVATHGAFVETMEARLSNLFLDIVSDQYDEQNRPLTSRIYPLKDLRTRDRSDPAIALLDAWATVGDVLTFYQERIANEGYLRTATERRSILELARLVGYKLRPGVSASVYLAYTLDDKSAPVEIPTGTRSQSVPGPGETAQFFETSEALPSRVEWNDLQPRMTRPQSITFQQAIVNSKQPLRTDYVLVIQKVFFEGTATNLIRGDSLLFVFGADTGQQVIRRVEKINADFAANRTEVILQRVPTERILVAYLVAQTALNLNAAIKRSDFNANRLPLAQEWSKKLSVIQQTILLGGTVSTKQLLEDAKGVADTLNPPLHALLQPLIVELEKLATLPGPEAGGKPTTSFASLVKSLLIPPAVQLPNRFLQNKSAAQVFSLGSDANPHLFASFHPGLGDHLYTAWANAEVNPSVSALQAVYALRVTAPLFGYNAPIKALLKQLPPDGPPPPGILAVEEAALIAQRLDDWSPTDEDESVIYLDQVYKEILPDSFVVVQKQFEGDKATPSPLLAVRVKSPGTLARTEYAISAKTTRLDLQTPWREATTPSRAGFTMADLRSTIVYAQSELLKLAEEPILDDVAGDTIETGRLYDGLEAGRWLIVTGERTDIAESSGVHAAELVMLAGIEQKYDPALPGDKTHSTLLLERALAYRYKRNTVKIYGNVVKATNGETRNEVLGSGNATQAFQQFVLKQPPLTYVSAATVEGIESTLHVRVNDVEWHETDSLALLAPSDRNYITVTDDDARTSVVFGDGKRGARPPTGIENITAVYRSGIGKGGNVKAEQITLPITRPLGVKEVINPLRASGGADKESRDLARRNAPLAVMALDRLVSTQDYADFARTFAGIAKASAARLTDGHRQLVHLTIAGVDDIPIDVTSDLYQNLRRALHTFGDPYQAVQIDVRELLALVLSARVHILPDYLEEKVEPKIRQALLDKFSFENRQLGQPAFLSEAISTIQRIEGVAYVDVEAFDSMSEAQMLAILAAQDTQAQDEQAQGQVEDAARQASSSLSPTLKLSIRAEGARLLNGTIAPAQLAFFLPNASDTLILNLIKEATV
jgi:predicted phage baseplate assembly protein